MSCEECNAMRDRLRAALLERKLGAAIQVVKEAVAFNLAGAKSEAVDTHDLRTPSDVPEAVRGDVQSKRSGRGARSNPASRQGGPDASADGLPSGITDGVDRSNAEDQS